VEKLKKERGSVLQVLNLRDGDTIPENFTGVISWDTGTKKWFLNNKLNREDGPACEYSNGSKEWYLNGELHREDGPAIEWINGRKQWWLNSKSYSEADWKVAVEKLKNPEAAMDNKTGTEQEEVLEPAILKVKTEEQVLDDYVGIVEFPDGEKQWRKGVVIHREDGPATIWANGTKEWVVNGEYHREDGPAIEYNDGSREWLLNGRHHRVDGPAIDMLYGPIKKWCLNGKYHREDGPAIEKGNKYKAWYLNGVRYSKKQWLVELEKLKKERERPTLESLKEKFKDNSTPLGEVFNDFIYDRYFDISISEDGKRVIVADKLCHEVSELYSYAEYSTADGSLIEGRYYSSKGERLTLADNLRALQAFREETIGIEGFKEKVLGYHGFKDGEYRIHNSSFVAKDKQINVYWIQKDKINYIFTVYNNKGKLIHEKVYGRSKTNLEILDSSLREDVISFGNGDSISRNEFRTSHYSANGKYHSLTGPAVIAHGPPSKSKQNEIYRCEYCINGVFMPKEVWFERAYDLTKDKQGLSFEEWKAKIEPTLPVVNVKEQALAVIENPKADTSTFAAVKKTIKSDAREVAKRIAVKRIIKFAAEFIANQFKSQKAAFKSIEEFLRSDRGTILLQLTAGTLLPQFKSSFPEKYHALYEEVCDELRIQAEVGLADDLIDVLVPAIKEQIHLVSFHNSSSEDIKVRVDSSVVETSRLETEEKKNLPEEAGQPFAEDLSVSRLETLASDRA
jgi:hypothetical protein